MTVKQIAKLMIILREFGLSYEEIFIIIILLG